MKKNTLIFKYKEIKKSCELYDGPPMLYQLIYSYFDNYFTILFVLNSSLKYYN